MFGDIRIFLMNSVVFSSVLTFILYSVSFPYRHTISIAIFEGQKILIASGQRIAGKISNSKIDMQRVVQRIGY